MLVSKSKRKEKEYIFDCLNPIIGIMQDDKFISSNDHTYYSMTSKELIEIDKLWFGYYNLYSISFLKEKYQENDIIKVIEKYKEEYKKTSYYVLTNNGEGAVTISFEKDKWSKIGGEK